jgi:hypothetical protein
MSTCNLTPALLAMLADLTAGWDVQINHARKGKAWCVRLTSPVTLHSYLYTHADLGVAIGAAFGGEPPDEVQPW